MRRLARTDGSYAIRAENTERAKLLALHDFRQTTLLSWLRWARGVVKMTVEEPGRSDSHETESGGTR